MLRLVAIAAVLLPALAYAQNVPRDAARDLWCGTAFGIMTRDMPLDATPEQEAQAKIYADGGEMLVDRALPIYLEAGYDDARLAELREDLADAIARIIDTGTSRVSPPHDFQECSALIGQ